MARPAPGVSRTVAVLNFFAAHPEQSFTLTDILTSLRLNRATCHSLLAALVDEGYLYRDNSKAYRLGPALAALGEVAHQSFQPAALARDDMRSLADELHLSCVAAARVGAEMVILERAVGGPVVGHHLHPGRRFPLRPPAGVSFIAWAPETEVREWLAGCRPALSGADQAGWRLAMERIRRQGFCFGLAGPVSGGVPAAAVDAGWLQPDHDLAAPGLPPAPVSPDEPIRLRYVSGPVLDRAGAIVCSIALYGFERPSSAEQVRELGARVKAVADRVTSATGGRPA